MLALRLILPAFAALLLAAAPAPAAKTKTRIIGGTTPSQAWPAQTSVRFTIASGSYHCAGTLVSARWVLTAGHCASNDSGAPIASGAYALRVGSTSRTSAGHTSNVAQVVRHPGYVVTGSPASDLALLRLTTAAPQEPLRLIGSAETALWSAGVQATIIGWGVTETGSVSTTLLEAKAPMTADATCLSTWGTEFSASSMVCAGGGSTDTCSGDSGGPLMVPRGGAFVLAGVTSWGASPCAAPGLPGVYARVGAPALGDWIRGLVPTVTVAVAPALPVTGQDISLVATPVTPSAQIGTPSLAWDLDDDGAFDDATGPTATGRYANAGNKVVRVQSVYTDGDRAVTREVLAVAHAAPAPHVPAAAPPPPPPPPPPSLTAPSDPPASHHEPQPQPQPEPQPEPKPQPAPKPKPQPEPAMALEPAGTVTPPKEITVRGLRSKHVRVRFSCARACDLTGRLSLGASTARRFGLTVSGPTVILGRGSASLAAAGRGTMTVRLTPSARRALSNRRRATIYLRTKLRASGALLAGASSITVRR